MDVILVAALCIGFASVIGGATGFGTSLIATPFMLMAGIGLTETVVVNLVVGLVTRIGVTYQLRSHITWPRVAVLGAASLPGALLGVFTVNLLPESYLRPAAGGVTVLCGLAMALSSKRAATPPTPVITAAVGAIGGYFSTTTSLNGPPVVLLLSRAKIPPLSFIGDLAGYFVITNTASLALLWLFSDTQFSGLGPLIVSCAVVGVLANQVGIWIAQRLPVHVFRSAVIVLVVIAGLLAITSA